LTFFIYFAIGSTPTLRRKEEQEQEQEGLLMAFYTMMGCGLFW